MLEQPMPADSQSGGRLKDVLREACVARRFAGTKEEWARVKQDIVSIEKEEFGDDGFEPEDLEADFLNKDNIVIVLTDSATGKTVGFTYAEPLSHFEDDDFEEKGRLGLDRVDNGEHTAYISDTVLDRAYRGHRLTGDMMAELEKELVINGYEFMERDSAVTNKYAANVEKTYTDRIVIQGNPHGSDYGPQVFFRIRLNPVEITQPISVQSS